MGVFGDIKDQFSVQDLGINSALGVVAGLATSRLLGVPAKGTFVSGGILGTAAYITDLVPEEHMTPMRSTLFTVFTLGLVVFGLTKAQVKYPENFLIKLLPREIKPLICVAALNVFGKTMMIYFPVIFPGFKTAPALPKALKDLFALPSKEVRVCHSYYDGNSDAFTALPVKTQVALNHTFEREKLTSLSTTPLAPTTFDSWETEELRLMREQEVSMGTADIERAFETKCFASELDPPKTISESFALPATVGAITALNTTHQKWYLTFFKAHPSKFDELSPAKQLAFLIFPEFAGFTIRAPKTTAEVDELDKAGVNLFHPDFDSNNHSPEVGLALIRRFAAEGLDLPKDIKEQLAKLPRITTVDEVNRLSPSDLLLYQTQFSQDPTSWNTLDVTVRWAFQAKKGTWPPMNRPSTDREIQTLSNDLVAHFHRTFDREQVSDENTRLSWYEKFYECQLPPLEGMAQDCSRILRGQKKTSPFRTFSNTGQVGLLTPAQLTWFSEVYYHYREAWIALPLNYQAQFRKKVSDAVIFPTFSYPISKEAVETLDAEATPALQKDFQMEIMQSTGRGFIKWGSSPLNDQDPALFKLSDGARRNVLVALGKKFTPPLPKGFDPYVEPPKEADKVRVLDAQKLDYWAKYFTSNPDKWNTLPLIIQIAYLQHAESRAVHRDLFPDLCISNAELKELAEKGNQAQATGTANEANTHYQAILYLASKACMFNLTAWVRWPREIQLLLKTAFGHLFYGHTDARLGGGPIPETPDNAPLGMGIDAKFIKAFHDNFHPTAFKGANCDALFTAFRDRFLQDLGGDVGILGLPKTLLKNIDLSNFTDEDRSWAQMILTHDAGQNAWKALTCQEQLIYRRECQALRGGIPIAYNGDHEPSKGHYTRPTLEEIPHFTTQDLEDLHNYYADESNPWMEVPYHIQEALNERFAEIRRQPFFTPWDVTGGYARSLTKDSYRAKSLMAFYQKKETLWNALDQGTRDHLRAATTALYLDPTVSQADHDSAKRTYYLHRIPHQLKRKVHSFKNRVGPYMTKRNMAIAGALGTTYVVTELAGIPNGVPDVIFSSMVGVSSWTLGTGWSLLTGTLSIAGSVVSYPFTSGGNVTAIDLGDGTDT